MTITPRLVLFLLALSLTFFLLHHWPATSRAKGGVFTQATVCEPLVAEPLATRGSPAQTVSVTDHRMTDVPQPANCVQPPVKTNFATTDARAYQWTLVDGAKMGDTVRMNFIQPNQSSYFMSDPATINFNGGVCFSSFINIAGFAAATLPGSWQVQVIYNGAVLVTTNFSIGASGGGCVTPPAGMTNWWPGDGNANDIRGEQTGTLRNGAGFAAGKVEQAFSLNGINQYVEVGDLDLPATFTIDAWIHPTSFPNAFPYILNKDGANQRSYFFSLNEGKLRAFVRNTAGQFTQYETVPVVSAGNWQHIAVTYDGQAATGQKMKFYLNGLNQPATVLFSQDSGGTPENNALPARLGIGGDGADRPFAGLIDEVEIFNHALTQAEIQAIVTADSAGKCKGGPTPTPTPGPTATPTPGPTATPTPGPTPGGSCPPGMLVWLRADGNANDALGMHNGMLRGSASASGLPKVGQNSFSFNGFTSTDYVLLPPTGIVKGQTAVTLEAWVFPRPNHGNGLNFGGTVFNESINNDGIRTRFGAFILNDGMVVAYGRPNDVVNNPVDLRTPVQAAKANEWSHIAVTWSTTDGVRIYVNGQQRASRSGPLGPFANTNSAFVAVGSDSNGNFGANFSGNIDELSIYNRVLSPAEIQTIFAADSAGKCASGPTPTPTPTPQLCPTVSGINPSSGLIGSTVTLSGANFTGVTSVRFTNNVAAQFTINSATQITASVPVGAVTGPIDVLKPGCGDHFTATFTVMRLCPTITNINPSSGQVGSTVLISGTNFSDVNGVRFTNNVVAPFTVISDTQISTTVPNGATTGSITVFKAFCPDTHSGAPFTVTQPSPTPTPTPVPTPTPPTNRTVRVVCGSAAPGSTLVVPVELIAQGDENALGFGLAFDPAVLTYQSAARGNAVSSGVLNLNTIQLAQGRLGLALALDFGQTFAAGPRQIINVTFTVAANTTATTTTIDFSDQPIRRQVSNANAQAIPANFTGCLTVSITRGYEADVTPRPNGKNDGTIAITDWVLVGRFAAGLDTPSAGSEFQRADCAPRDRKGDGELVITDWVQAGRYAANLDAPQTAGGPTAPSALRDTHFGWRNTSGSTIRHPPSAIRHQQRTLRLANTNFVRGQLNTLNIELDALGDENALGFSLDFDPNVLTFVSAAVGSGAGNGLLIVNNTQAANGRLGLALALPAGEQLAAGARTVIVARFNIAANSTASTAGFSFGDQPIRRQVADANANALPASFRDSSLPLNNAVASVSAASFMGQQLSPESIVAAFGVDLATNTVIADQVPLPTTLAGTNVRVRDSAGVERPAPLFFVAPTQINYLIPPGTASGTASITITSGSGTISVGSITIAAVAPGLFTANATGQGVPAAAVLRVKADGSQSYEPVARFDAASNRFASLPIELGPVTDQVFLILFGTGLRGNSSLANVSALFGGLSAQVFFVGAQGLVGLDQVNLAVPRASAGRGEVEVRLVIDGKEANTVRVNIK